MLGTYGGRKQPDYPGEGRRGGDAGHSHINGPHTHIFIPAQATMATMATTGILSKSPLPRHEPHGIVHGAQGALMKMPGQVGPGARRGLATGSGASGELGLRKAGGGTGCELGACEGEIPSRPSGELAGPWALNGGTSLVSPLLGPKRGLLVHTQGAPSPAQAASSLQTFDV